MQLCLVSDTNLGLAEVSLREGQLFGQVSSQGASHISGDVVPALLLSTNHSHASCWEALKYNQMLCMTRLSKSILQKVLLTTLFSATPAILPSPKYSRYGQGQVKNPKSTGEMLLPTPRDFESLTLTVRTSSRFAIPYQVPLSMLSTGLFYPSASTVINRIKVRYQHLTKREETVLLSIQMRQISSH